MNQDDMPQGYTNVNSWVHTNGQPVTVESLLQMKREIQNTFIAAENRRQTIFRDEWIDVEIYVPFVPYLLPSGCFIPASIVMRLFEPIETTWRSYIYKDGMMYQHTSKGLVDVPKSPFLYRDAVS